MTLKSLSLHNFRSYKKKTFDFHPSCTVIVGPNTAGKTNLMEAIIFLGRGKSSKGESHQFIRFGEEVARIIGKLDNEKLELVLTAGMVMGIKAPMRRYMVNDVPKRRIDFTTHLTVVSFAPSDLDIISGSPTLRREFLDEVLEQVDTQYHSATSTYIKALRQRNALLHTVQETGIRDPKLFEYWDDLLITHGSYIHKKREEFIAWINSSHFEVFPLRITYDHSVISKERLHTYKDAEVGSGVTLVGPHRDDFFVEISTAFGFQNTKLFGSRGQQRLTILQLKLLQLSFIEKEMGQRPLLLLDDIFSELDSGHIELVQDLLGKQQSIITTTHKEFLEDEMLSAYPVLELEIDG